MWIVLLVVVVTICLFFVIEELVFKLKNYPKAPPRLPFFGNLLQLDKLHPLGTFQKWAKQFGPVTRVHFGSKVTYVLNTVEAVQEALVNQDAIFQFRHSPPGVFYPKPQNGKPWRLQRKLLSFHVMKGVDKKTDVVRSVVYKYLNDFANEGNPVNPNLIIKRITFGVIYKLMFNSGEFDDTKIDFLIRSAEKTLALFLKVRTNGALTPNFLKFVPFFNQNETNAVAELNQIQERTWSFIRELIAERKQSGKRYDDFLDIMLDYCKEEPEFAELNQIQERTWSFIRELIAERKQSGKRYDDFLDIMLDYCKEEPEFDELDMQMVVTLLFNAGTDTTGNATEFLLITFAKRPDIQQKCFDEVDRFAKANSGRLPSFADQKEVPYLDATLKEILRFMPPGPLGVARFPSVDAKVCGTTIPAGSTVMTNIWSMCRDPLRWDKPDEFRPERFLQEEKSLEWKGAAESRPIDELKYLPFMIGRRYCPGMPLVRVEFFTLVAALLHQYEWKAPPGVELTYDYVLGVSMQPKPFQILAEKRA
eukprot:TRINITY_DN6954_c0_g1_i4.p1 TRINITY_DN6954_c0_g1~~TRINITY_DN6954_c0_g1_i4.p1  ORF type:complete len:534 (-),score=139.70 TRINITY_DN6954_c0_g1_i4:1604-3205(-)